MRGRPVDHLLQRYQGLSTEGTYLARHPQRVAGQRHVWRGELAQARPLLTEFRDGSEEWAEAYALGRLHLCELDLRAGDWDDVQRLLDEWAQSTDSVLLHWPMYERCRGLLVVGRGDVEEARRWAGRARDMALKTGVRWDWLESSRALGLAALLAKDPGEAVPAARRGLGVHAARGRARPGGLPGGSRPGRGAHRERRRRGRAGRRRGAGGRRRRAGPRVGARWAPGGRPPWWRSPRTGTPTRPVRSWRPSRRRTRGWGWPSTRRGPCSSSGVRSAGPRSGAPRATSLERTVAAFEALGSPGWAVDAGAELERVGARKSASDGLLTATERRVADLAVEGLANKEIARTLVVTVNTVEFHLRNTYAKLGIRSRVQLAAALSELETAAE